MSRMLTLLALLVLVSGALFGQEKKKKAARPDIPGSFMVDFGFNHAMKEPAEFQQAFWGSRTVNFYYQYPIHFGHSKYSFNPGVGISLERWKFKNEFTLAEVNTNGDLTYSLVSANTIYPNVKKSMLVTNYLEAPLEFRYDTNPEDIARSFSVAVGARVGFLFDSFTKIKYKEDGQTKKIKDKQDWGLNPYRYGVYSRVGIGAFNFFCFYNLTTVFQENKGPSNTGMNSLTFGISLNGF